MRIAYLTNSSDRSGVGYRALEIKKHIRAGKEGVTICGWRARFVEQGRATG